MLIVESDPTKVEADLVEGRAACPACGGCWRGWAFARRRFVRTESGPAALRPRRARCRSCTSTQVLLPDVLLCRRVDTVAVIGAALTAAAGGGLPAGGGCWSAGRRQRCGAGCAGPGSGGPAGRALHGVGAPPGPDAGPIAPSGSAAG